MDGHKRIRKAKRSAFTHGHTQIVALLNAAQPNILEIRAQYSVLKDKIIELNELNTLIHTLMQSDETTTDEEFEAEINRCDEYDLKFHQIKQAVLEKTETMQPPPEQPGNDNRLPEFNGTLANQTMQEVKRYRLPKMEVPEFSGDIKDWLSFWGRFKGIHESTDLKDEEKFQYLIQAMTKGSRASQLVNSFPLTAENYPKAIESLETRFGRKDLLVEVYVRELLKLVLSKTPGKGTPSIEKIYDQIETHLRSLESLGVTTNMCAAMLYPLVESALPEETLRAWQRHPTSSGITGAEARLTALMTFLSAEVEAKQRIAMASGGFGVRPPTKVSKEVKSKKSTTNEKKSTSTAAGLLAAEPTKEECLFCADNHQSADCEKARKMSYADRVKIAQERDACFNCLKLGHSYKSCRYKQKCPWCQKRHVVLMCRGLSSQRAVTPADKSDDKTTVQQTLVSLAAEPEVFLQTLRVKLVNGERSTTVRALIDHGSHRSYIIDRVANQMAYESEGTRTMTHLLFGGSRSTPVVHKQYKVHLRSLDDSFECHLKAYQQPLICQSIGHVRPGPWLTELKRNSIELTDTGADNQPIALLLGADIAGKLYTGKMVQLACGATAMHTRLGWTLIGENASSYSDSGDPALLTVSMFVQNASVTQLWSLDALGITDPIERRSKLEQEQRVMNDFRETITINPEKRYEVFLPWKESHPPLPRNRDTAERRLATTLKKLNKDNLLRDYEAVLDEWLEDGIIERVPEKELGNTAYYLPHRAVVKEGSTTRIRPVFDASAKEKESPSLNQCLETGPNLIEYIPSLLTRFRKNRVGIIADIKKAFLQISIAPGERDKLRFLWRRGGLGPLVEYRHCRVVFGVSSSPFQLGATIEFHLDAAIGLAESEEDKIFLELLKNSFYVDNSVASLSSVTEAEKFRDLATEIMASGGFDLRGWEYSSQPGERETASVLGLMWDKCQDVLQLSEAALNQSLPDKVTKRIILSFAQKVFDPIGMACPTLLIPKLILQKLWHHQLAWDSEVDDDVRELFLSWCRELPLLRELKVRRWAYGDDEDSLSLHLFVDASQEAYAAVIYSRVETSHGVHVDFIEAKTRVAPKEQSTIPRLELLAATVGARLLRSVLDTVNKSEIEVYCWTDSTTALAWIQRNCQWATFVFNRVQEIRRLTQVEWWRHIPGEENPADLPSRGCSAEQLVASKWIDGPEWLSSAPSCWPTTEAGTEELLVQSELKKTKGRKMSPSSDVVLISASEHRVDKQVNTEDGSQPQYFNRFSSYKRVVNVMAWIRRFIHNSQPRRYIREAREITSAEWRQAEHALFRRVQQESFEKGKDPRLRTLRVFKDNSGLLRLCSPVEQREDTYSFRNPIVLDPRHPLVRKLIQYWHEKLRHASIDTIISVLRERVWILQCRRAVTTVTHQCVVCRRHHGDNAQPPPSALPLNRVRDTHVFEITGMDFAGPLHLKDGSKVWVCLFTCAVYRAVHLELVSSLSTEMFLEALRRFIARRGRPSTIYADNATNFRGARNLLKNVQWKRVTQDNSTEEIEWRFNPPSGPWWGGWWERLIRILKDLLRKILKRALLTYEELVTVLCEVEAIMNARPLTYLAEDPQQLTPLTPRSFLQDIQETGIPDIDGVDANSLNRRLRYRLKLREQLRQRFRAE